jgi:hypothetical protein
VLYTFSPNSTFEKYYQQIQLKFPHVQFILEDGHVEQILEIIGKTPKQKAGYELLPFFSFMVDDMIFFRDLKLIDCLTCLRESTKAYALHLKLSPGIYFSHTANKIMRLPNFEPVLKPN